MKERRSREPQVTLASGVAEDAKAYEEHSLRELRAAGYRITMPRVQVIRALADTNKALSAYAIHEKIISGGGKIDVVSVYRILSTLQEVGLIHHIGVVDGYFPCRMENCDGKRSEVLVCEDSGDVMELALPAEVIEAIERQTREHGFEPSTVKVEITGCRK
jgi:Fe2+ or Zn2+ uptake regulation protein